MKRFLSLLLLITFIFSAESLLAQRKKGGGASKRNAKGIGIIGKLVKQSRRAGDKSRARQISRFTGKTLDVKAKKHYMVGGALGASNYFGDLAPRNKRSSSDIRLTRTYISGFGMYRVHPHIVMRGSISWARLRGDDFSVSRISNPDRNDKGRYVRNLHFRNDVKEISVVGLFEVFPTDKGYLRRNFLNLYGILGLGVFHHNPRAMVPNDNRNLPNKGRWVPLRPLGTEGQFTNIPGTPKPYSRIQVSIPMGFGLRYRIHDKFDLSLEIGYRFMFTDYLDDVSGRYPTEEVYKAMFERNPLSVAMSNRTTEARAAVTGQSRDLTANNNFWLDGRQIKNDFFVDNNGVRWTRTEGSENNANENEPRGLKSRDYYVTTSLGLCYYIEIKEKAPRFR
jgi:hypothetical protein